jgi:sterol desaturase/sphingolipid hydroxylase (fatty acid hydroxylase superfamily)
MKMSKFGYFSEFLLFPPLIVAATLLAFHKSPSPRPIEWLFVFALGIVAWTLVEYFLHRVLFHHAPILSIIHERHHDEPRELIGTPAWLSALVGLFAVAGPAWAIVGLGLDTAAMGGLVTGYLGYVFVHYASHHWQPRRGSYLYQARLRHARHHHMSHAGNFGVTTSLWDRVFGTFLENRITHTTAID